MAWTSPRTWLAGEEPTAALYNAHIRDNFKAIGDAWTAYTPTWSASGTAPALGNGTIVGAWLNAGKLVHGRIFLTMGSTTTYGTGNYTFTIPFSSTVGAQWFPMGGCVCRDASAAATYYFGSFTAGITSITGGSDSSARLGQLVPFTWANTDTLGISYTYEAA